MTSGKPVAPRRTTPGRAIAWPRLPFLLVAMTALFAAAWGGLLRMNVIIPLLTNHANWLTFHGPVMVCVFLGTLISLERAVGLGRTWTYAAPLFTGAGGILILCGYLGRGGPLLIALGSAVFAGVSVQIVRLQKARYTVTMALGAAAWLTSNVLWLRGWAFPRLVPWWIAFLALIIVGERLDLSRFQKPERLGPPLFLAAAGLFLSSVVLSLFSDAAGGRLLGLGLLALAAWLARFDIARRTVKQPGLPRFMAVCLLGGYAWLAFAGVMFASFSPMEAGAKYDAALHAFFLGFVFAMIFGHAPVIFPAVLQRPVAYSPRFYAHVILLHASLVLRVAGDLFPANGARQWGGILNAISIALFLLNTIVAMALPPRKKPA